MSAVVLTLIGLFGLSGMTWLFPLLGHLSARWFKSPGREISHRSGRAGEGDVPSDATIAIPVHNEGPRLEATLRSVAAAVSAARNSGLKTDVVVLCDGCSDDSAQIAKNYGARIKLKPVRGGKWLALQELVHESRHSPWIILADAGVLWPEDFLTHVASSFGDESVMGIAPSYRNGSEGFLELMSWKLEALFKNLESGAGGPVSVHGATVCYRSAELVRALEELEGKKWLNDDVVIPLTMRALHPAKRIVYLSSLHVSESPQTESRPEFNRRRRMVLGNIEWMRVLSRRLWSENRIAALFALRRMFRVFWAYWLAFSAIGIFGILFAPHLSSAVLVLIAVSVLSFAMLGSLFVEQSKLLGTVAASLLAPLYLVAPPLSQLAHPAGGRWR